MAEDPTERFATLLARSGGPLPLDEGLLLIAAHALPELEVADQMARLDALAGGVAEASFDGVRAHLFETLGFTGDTDTYYDPRNSLLPEVLERRRGIPLTLVALTMEVGRRCGVELQGIGMPGHFLARSVLEPHRYLDAFDGGRELDEAGCRAVFAQAGSPLPWDDAFLQPSAPSAILARLLANLATAYRRGGDRRGLCWALDLRLRLPGASEQERRELGVLLGASGRFAEGAAILEGSVAEGDRDAAARLRARLN